MGLPPKLTWFVAAFLALSCGRIGYAVDEGGDGDGDVEDSGPSGNDSAAGPACQGRAEACNAPSATTFGIGNSVSEGRAATESTDVIAPSCGHASAADLVKGFVARGAFELVVTTPGSTGDVTIAVFESCTGVELACAQASPGGLRVDLVDNQEFVVVVESADSCEASSLSYTLSAN